MQPPSTAKYIYLSSRTIHIEETAKAYTSNFVEVRTLSLQIECIDQKTGDLFVIFTPEASLEKAIKLVTEHFEVSQENFEVKITSIRETGSIPFLN